MTKDQISFIRKVIFATGDDGKLLSYTSTVCLPDMPILRMDSNPVIWLDDQELVIKFAGNTEFGTQSEAPIEMTIAPYDSIYYMHATFDHKNLSTALDLLGVSGEEKEFIIKYAKTITVQAHEDLRPNPYYTTDVMPNNNKKYSPSRDDNIDLIEHKYAVETNPAGGLNKKEVNNSGD